MLNLRQDLEYVFEIRCHMASISTSLSNSGFVYKWLPVNTSGLCYELLQNLISSSGNNVTSIRLHVSILSCAMATVSLATLLRFLATFMSMVMVIVAETNLTYTNPILPGFYPDPSCIYVSEWNNTWFCASSSFNAFPGIPIHARTSKIGS